MAPKPPPPPARERVQIPSGTDLYTVQLVGSLYNLADEIAAGRALPQESGFQLKTEGGRLFQTTTVRVLLTDKPKEPNR